MSIEDVPTTNYHALEQDIAGPESNEADRQAFEDLLMEQHQRFLEESAGNEDEASRKLSQWISDQLPAEIRKQVIEQRHVSQDKDHNDLSNLEHQIRGEAA